MSALEVLEHLREANPKELAMVRDTAESLLSAAQLTSSEDREIVEALEESEAQFARGEGIPAAEAGYLRRIAAEIDALSTMPSRFPFWKTSQKYRFLIAEKYLAFFQIEGMRVKVSHVRYAGRSPFRG